MSQGRRKEITYRIPEEELDEKLAEADDGDTIRRLSFVKNLYQGDTIEEAADRIGRSEATGDRWADAWNEGGFDELAPSYGGGRPPKLDETEQQRLKEMLKEDQPWKSQEIQRLIRDEFDVEYHPDYLGTFLRNLGFTYSVHRRERPGNVRESLEDGDDPLDTETGEHEDGWTLEETCTDGGTVPGSSEASHPRPHDSSR